MVEVAGNIKKAQQTQSKYHNQIHNTKPLNTGQKVLKRNLKDASREEKLVWKSSAHPCTITGISECGNVYAKDIWGKAHKRSLPPSQLKPYKDCNNISSDEDTAPNCTNTVSAIKSFLCQELPLTTVCVINDDSSSSPAHKKYKIDLNMPVEKIPIEVLEKIEESDIQTAINESHPNESNPHFQDFTTQDVDPEDPELLVTGVIADLSLEFNPLNYMQMKRIATEVLKLNFDTSIPEVQY